MGILRARGIIEKRTDIRAFLAMCTYEPEAQRLRLSTALCSFSDCKGAR